MKMKMVLALLVCSILIFSGCGTSKSENSNIKDFNNGNEIIDNSNNTSENISENNILEKEYINDAENKSNDKLAFIFNNVGQDIFQNDLNNVVITIDYEGLTNNEAILGLHTFQIGSLNLYYYYREYDSNSKYIFDVQLDNTHISIHTDENSIFKDPIAINGEWELYTYNSHYRMIHKSSLKEDNTTGWYIPINKYDDEEAKDTFNLIASTMNIYFTENDYLNVKDFTGNDVSLIDYNYIQDIAKDLLKKEFNFNIKSAYDISKCGSSMSIDSKDSIYYDLKFTDSLYSKEAYIETIDINSTKAEIYNGDLNEMRILINCYKEKGYVLHIWVYDSDETTQKSIEIYKNHFIETFK